jgi:putative transposase
VKLRDRSLAWFSGTREESLKMAKRGHGEEEILRVLRAESRGHGGRVCRKHGISQQPFYLWKKKYVGLGLQELRQLRNENAKPKRLVADLTLGKTSEQRSTKFSTGRRLGLNFIEDQNRPV